ncbi:hypothetical protein WJX84_011322 [Apatococcus fuscideae]|uniref:Cupin-like domain-containing protein n=1 Tax=Apatococcus fuscideae TaxID=2026836 RepID=A0AAW1SIH5_9CHLO
MVRLKKARKVPAAVLTAQAFRALEEDAVPCHILGALEDWPAAQLWQEERGLQHLNELAGAQEVQAMTSSSSYFQGDMGSHEPTTCTFQSFLSSRTPAGSSEPNQAALASASPGQAGPAALKALMADVRCPAFLPCAPSEINLWMSMRGSCSSLHYDPYQNLLAVVRGCKTVHLYPPDCGPDLSPRPVWGESPNHSTVNSFQPDSELYPGLERALSSRVTCHLQSHQLHLFMYT